MTIKDIIEMEKINLSGITLLKEGMFYRAYNRSAMRMSTKVRPLKVNKKLIKYVGEMVLYCGFPDNILSEVRNLCVQKNYGWHVRGETRIDIEGVAMLDEDYEGWVRAVLKQATGALLSSPKDQRELLAGRIGMLFLEILELLKESGYVADQAQEKRSKEVSG